MGFFVNLTSDQYKIILFIKVKKIILDFDFKLNNNREKNRCENTFSKNKRWKILSLYLLNRL